MAGTEAVGNRALGPAFPPLPEAGATSVSMLTLAARIMGFIRVIAQSVWVGSRDVAHAFVAANQLPNILFEVIAGGALSAALIPALATSTTSGWERFQRQANALLTWILVIMTGLAALMWLAAPLLASALPYQSPPGTPAYAAQYQVTALMIAIFAWQLPLYGIGIVATAILQVLGRFNWPALAPLLSSIVVTACFALYGWSSAGADSLADTRSILILAWGVNLGVAALSLPLLVVLARAGLRLRPTLGLERRLRRTVIRLGGAGMAAVIAQQIAIIAVIYVARSWGDTGAQAVHAYTQAVYLLPVAVIVIPLATVTFPRLAACELADCADLVRELTPKLYAAGIIATSVLIVAAYPAYLFFSAFTPVPGMFAALIILAPATLGAGILHAFTRVYSAANRPGRVLELNLWGWGGYAATAPVLCYLLATTTGAEGTGLALTGLAAAQLLGMTAALGATMIHARKDFQVSFATLRHSRDLYRAGAAVPVALTTLAILLWMLPAPTPPGQGVVTQLVVAVSGGCLGIIPTAVVAANWWRKGGMRADSRT